MRTGARCRTRRVAGPSDCRRVGTGGVDVGARTPAAYARGSGGVVARAVGHATALRLGFGGFGEGVCVRRNLCCNFHLWRVVISRFTPDLLASDMPDLNAP